MGVRWIVATVSALALALLTLGAPLPPLWHSAAAAGPFSCPANAKQANLNFTLKDLNNKDVKFSSYKGKVILIDFWATWCGPCKVEIPGFVDLQTRYGKQGFQVLGISIDDKLEDLKPYATEYKMNYPVLQGLGHDEVQDAFGPLLGIPVSVIIGRDGRICSKHAGLTSKEMFENEIKSLL